MKTSRFTKQIILLAVLPVVLLCTYFFFSSWYKDRDEYYRQVWNDLQKNSLACMKTFQQVYPEWDQIDSLDKAKEMDFSFLKVIAGVSDCDLSIFYKGMRIATTIVGPDGTSMVGTLADSAIVDTVIKNGRDYRASQITIADKQYYGYYRPLVNAGGEIIGMAFAGKYISDIKTGLLRSVIGGLLKLIALTAFLGFLAFLFAKKIVEDLHEIMDYMGAIANGNFNHKMDPSVLRRQDEFGELANHSVRVSEALQNLIQKDPLTGLFNRRACTTKLSKMISKANTPGEEQVLIGIAMLDIDNFKKVNDTYGHSMGDEVLKEVSLIIQKYVSEAGFAARWGGEEFLLVTNLGKTDLQKMLELLCDEIRRKEFTANYVRFSITVTVGAAQYRSPDRMDNVINIADRRLYLGKESGRNRIVME